MLCKITESYQPFLYSNVRFILYIFLFFSLSFISINACIFLLLLRSLSEKSSFLLFLHFFLKEKKNCLPSFLFFSFFFKRPYNTFGYAVYLQFERPDFFFDALFSFILILLTFFLYYWKLCFLQSLNKKKEKKSQRGNKMSERIILDAGSKRIFFILSLQSSKQKKKAYRFKRKRR